MPREPRAYLHDMREAAALIADADAGVDDMLVWDMVGTRLSRLRREVEELLGGG